MARRIKRAQQQKLSKAEKKATRQQQFKKIAALTGLLCLSPNFIFPSAVIGASYNVNDPASLNAAMAQPDTNLGIIFDNDIGTLTDPLTANLPSNSTATNVTINGGNNVLDGHGSYRLLRFDNAASITLNMNNLTISGGSAVIVGVAANGGGMHVSHMLGGSVQGNTFTSNRANNQGGGMYVNTMDNVSVEGNTFSGNRATANNGGGMFVNTMDNVSVEGNTFTSNFANNNAGGMYVGTMNSGSVQGNVFSYNSANFGGGLYVSTMNGGSIGGAAVGAGNSFIGNSAINSQGGGLYVRNITSGQVQGNIFMGNSGGGAYIYSMEDGQVLGNTFGGAAVGEGNFGVTFGGGLNVYGMESGQVGNNSFTGNSATSQGGGLYVRNITSGQVAGNSFTGNTAGASGGGMFVLSMLGGGITGNTFAYNLASGVATTPIGGGMYVFDMKDGTVANNSFTANSATDHAGGMGVATMSGGSIMGNTFTNNLAGGGIANPYGGGLWVMTMSGGGITGNTFAYNSATSGGGMYVATMSGGSITGNTFANNLASGAALAPAAGGMLVATMENGTVANNSLAHNWAFYGGGMQIISMQGGIMQGNTFTNNHADSMGGGMFISSITSGTLADNIFINNHAGDLGGAIYYDGRATNGQLTLRATSGGSAVFAGNTQGAANDANSIYFTHAAGGNETLALTIDVDANGTFLMQDPMMNVIEPASSLTLNITKTGGGVWQLGGHNDMQGPGAWNINQGSLRLLQDTAGNGAHIDLSNTTASFSLAAGAALNLDGTGHKITAPGVTLAHGAKIQADGARLSTAESALSIDSTTVTLPGVIEVNTVNAGALDGAYTIIEDNQNTDYSAKVSGLFDGQSAYVPINERYGVAAYDYSRPGQVRIMTTGADAARDATWDNNSGDNLWNQTSKNWVLTGHAAKTYKAGDSPIFTGSPDGTVKVDGAMDADVMTVQNGSYTFSPHNNAGDGITGNRLDITGGQAAFDVPLDFNGSGAGGINVASGAAITLAPNSSIVKTNTFNLNGSLYVVPMAAHAYIIDAANINFNSGSKVGVSGFTYGDVLSAGSHSVLSLAASNINNQSAIAATSGNIAVGIYDYNYTNLYWDGNNLKMVVGSPTPNPQRRGDAAITAPTAIAAQMTPGTWLNPRFKYSFKANKSKGQNLAGQLAVSMINPGSLGSNLDYEPNLLPASHGPVFGVTASDLDSSQPMWLGNAAGGGDMLLGNGSLWFTPTYSYTDNSGRAGYNIKTPSWAGGYEQWFNNSFFLGLAVAGSLPEYKSHDADVDGKNISLALYGGLVLPWDMELGAFVTYGHTSYDQTRRVQGESYSSDYDSKNMGFGLNVGRDFMLDKSGLYVLRPFASYEYMRLDIDGYNEGNGQYALEVGGHKENLHFARVGVDTTATAKDSGAFVTGSVYYAGLYGDREASTGAFFTNDPANPFTSVGDALDKHSLGLGVSAGLPLGDNVELQAGYNFMAGEDNKTHQGNLSILLKF